MDFLVANFMIVLICWGMMALAVLLDMWTGIEKARARGERITSGNLRRTVSKMVDYWRVQVFGLMADVFASLVVDYPFASILCTLGVIIIEARSVIENYRKKKSAAAALPDIITQIIRAKSRGDAASILELLRDKTDAGTKKGTDEKGDTKVL